MKKYLLFFSFLFLLGGCSSEKVEDIQKTVQEKKQEVTTTLQEKSNQIQQKGEDLILDVSETVDTTKEVIEMGESLKDSMEGLKDNTILAESLSGGDTTSICLPLFAVEKDSSNPEARGYAIRCYEKITKEECEKVDIYNEKTKAFGSVDKVPDCTWQE